MFDKFASTVVALLFIAVTAQSPRAQAPSSLVYQGRLTATSGAPLTGSHTVTFRLYALPVGGTTLWTEAHSVSPDENGVFTVELGVPDPIDAIIFDGSKRFLGMALDGGLEMSPRQLIASAPYAVSAKTADVADASITGSKLADGAVVGTKIAADAVTSDKILDGTITMDDIGTDAVGFNEIRFSSIVGQHIVDGSVAGNDLSSSITLGTAQNRGYLETLNDAGKVVIQAGTTGVYGGLINVNNQGGSPTAGMNGETGVVWGNLKSFIVADPRRADRLIQYSSIEGPEAAIYCRGQIDLIAGAAAVSFPEHFADMAAPGTMTVSLTPRSLASRGLAALDLTPAGMTVGELAGGSGSYAVDYVVYAVRKGFENYEVYQSRAQHEAATQAPVLPPREGK